MKLRLANKEIRIRLNKEEMKLLGAETLFFEHPLVQLSVKTDDSFQFEQVGNSFNISIAKADFDLLHEGISKEISVNGSPLLLVVEEDWKSRKKG